MKYSSETLRISTLALPAISGGIFHVKLESVIKALHTALRQYTDEYKKTSHTPIFKSVYLVNNSHAVTKTAAYLFQELFATGHPLLPAASPAPLSRTSGHQVNPQRRSDKRVEEKMQIWTPGFIRQKQEEDIDIKAVIHWFKDDNKPDWNTVRARSSALKAYWHQLDSLKIKDGILYRQQ